MKPASSSQPPARPPPRAVFLEPLSARVAVPEAIRAKVAAVRLRVPPRARRPAFRALTTAAPALRCAQAKDTIHPAERVTVQSTVDGGRERSLEAMADCATMMISPGVEGAAAPAAEAAAAAAWASWTPAARAARFVSAGNWPI